MKNNKNTFPNQSYLNDLSIIKSIKFTSREIDVIACLLSIRGGSKIASILSISPNTVEAHTYNIMKKLHCSSRENIIDFIEESGKAPFFRNHYSILLVNVVFKKTLKTISGLLQSKDIKPVYFIEDYPDQESKNSFVYFLKESLTHTGIKTTLKSKKNIEFFSQFLKESQDKTIIYKISKVEFKESVLEMESLLGSTKKTNHFNNILFLLYCENNEEFVLDLRLFNYIDMILQENEYFLILEILEKIVPSINFKKIILEFKEKYANLLGVAEAKIPQESFIGKNTNKAKSITFLEWQHFLKKKTWAFILSLLVIGTFGFGLHVLIRKQNQEAKETQPIRSDLVLPTESTLLNRPELISQLDRKFREPRGIRAIAIVGPGGAGKTTLARQYAHSQKSPLVWEINAETKENLKSSFEQLAQALSKTGEDQKILRGFQEIKDSKEKEEKIVQFVKVRLRDSSDWFLIFDNVEKFTDIQQHFPQDYETWGRGKIILTTRDLNIQNNKHINHALQIGELSALQKSELFMKIINNGYVRTLSSDTKKFLEEIPPFPLDVSVAAYYLKTTNVSYGKYLENLRHYNKDFASVQENLLKESGYYTKTRYKIITLSLHHLINTHKDFADLLLFISLLDSQNIPRGLLEKYKNQAVVDNFIYHLKKYSLVTDESSHPSHPIPTLSVHRSTQDIALTYLVKVFVLDKNSPMLKSIAHTLENYIDDALEQQDFLRLKLLRPHCEMFLVHKNLLTDAVKGAIGGGLGGIYTFQYDVKAKQLLEKSLITLYKHDPENYIQISQVLLSLGQVNWNLGKYEKAKDLYENGLILSKEHFSKNPLRVAMTLANFGNVLRELGHYKEAKDVLEQSLVLYKKYYPEHHIRVANALTFLGFVYYELAHYEKAKKLLKQSLVIHKTYHPKNPFGVRRALTILGLIYIKLRKYKKAKRLIEQSIIVSRNFILKIIFQPFGLWAI